jgi:hypothetical protein
MGLFNSCIFNLAASKINEEEEKYKVDQDN